MCLPQTVRLRFGKAGVATIEIRGVTNDLEWDPVNPNGSFWSVTSWSGDACPTIRVRLELQP